MSYVRWVCYDNIYLIRDGRRFLLFLSVQLDSPAREPLLTGVNVEEISDFSARALVDMQYLKWTDFKWDERPVRLIVPPYGKTKQGWETFITDELAERLKIQSDKRTSDRLWMSANRDVLTQQFRKAARHYPDLDIVTIPFRGTQKGIHRIHLYSLKKYFFSQCTAEIGDAIAHAWCGRKSYLSTYLRLPLEDRQKLYLRVMPRLAVYSQELPKPKDQLKERLRARGLSDEVIDRVLEGLILN